MNMTEAEMFKQMELGKIMAEDVLPKVAKEYSRVANENGALEVAQEKVNSQLQRFLNALTQIKREMFTGGLGKGMADSFKLMANFLNENREEFKVFGQVIGTVVKNAAIAFGAILSPLTALIKSFNAMFGDRGAIIAGHILSMMALAKAVSYVALAFAAANFNLLLMVKNMAKYIPLIAGAMYLEDAHAFATGNKNSSDQLKGHFTFMDRMAQSSVGQVLTSPLRTINSVRNGHNPFALEVRVNDSEFSKAIDVRVKGANEENLANTAASVGG